MLWNGLLGSVKHLVILISFCKMEIRDCINCIKVYKYNISFVLSINLGYSYQKMSSIEVSRCEELNLGSNFIYCLLWLFYLIARYFPCEIEGINHFEDKIRSYTTIFWLHVKREISGFFLSFHDLKIVSILSSVFEIVLITKKLLLFSLIV